MTNYSKPETIALNSGWRADPTNGSVAVTSQQATCLQFENTEQAANICVLSEMGHM